MTILWLGSWVIEAFVKRGASLRGLSDFRFRRLFVASPNVLEIEMDFLNPSVEARVKFGVWKNAYVGWVKVLCYFFSTFFRGLCVPTDQFSVLAQTIGYLHQAKVIVQLQVDALQCRPEEVGHDEYEGFYHSYGYSHVFTSSWVYYHT